MSLLPTNVMNVYTVMKFEFKIHMLYLCLPVNINIFLTGKKICQKLIKKIFQLKLKKKKPFTTIPSPPNYYILITGKRCVLNKHWQLCDYLKGYGLYGHACSSRTTLEPI